MFLFSLIIRSFPRLESELSFLLESQNSLPFYYKWWFLVPFFIFLIFLFRRIIQTTSKFNKELVEDFSESNYPYSELTLNFLYLGLIFLFAEFIYLIFYTRNYRHDLSFYYGNFLFNCLFFIRTSSFYKS